MNTKRSPLLYLLLFLAFVQIIMLVAVGIVPVVRSAALSAVQSRPRLELSAALADLAAKSDLVVQAQVVETRSQWNHNHTLIETAHTLAVRQSLLGPTAVEVVVYSDGGFLADEGLGMFSSHTPRFAIGEEVLVFLQQENNRYQVTDGEAGKFTLFQEDVASAYYRDHLPLAQVATILAATVRTTYQASQPIAHAPVGLTSAAAVQADKVAPMSTATPTPLPKWSGATPQITLKVNLNSTQIGGPAGSADQFLTAIKGALRTWSVIPEAGATLLYSGSITSTTTSFNRQSEIIFMKKGANSQLGQAQIWFTSNFVIVEADLWINDDYPLDATGSPENGEIDLESIVLHELGHWLPLSHMPNTNAVMYAVLGAGMRKTILNSDDIAGITTLYPCPAIPCVDPAYAGDATATLTATTTPTPAETAAPDATATPTATMTPSAAIATPTPAPSAITPAAQQNSFLPLVTR
ncbi:MAG: hypothetical protein DYG89_39575 [Caldilinea sp. CFX5]|nr:hypothetical protein [Caldilinea sp. CFX5]